MAEIASAKLSIRPELLPTRRRSARDRRRLRRRAPHRRGGAARLLRRRPRLRRRRTAAARVRASGRQRVDLVVGDASRLPFRDGAFDAVICTETLEHLPDDVGAIARDRAPAAARRHAARRRAVALHGAAVLAAVARLLAHAGRPRAHLPPAPTGRGSSRAPGLRVDGVRYVHFVDSLVWLRFCLADFLRPKRPRQRLRSGGACSPSPRSGRSPPWRTRLRPAIGRSRFIAALDTAGALVWPKSFTFVATKAGSLARDPRRGIAETMRAIP